MRQALEQGAQQMVSAAKNLVPKESGALAASIGATFGNYAPDNANVRGMGKGGAGDPDLTVTVHAGDANAFYASFVEFGTSPHSVSKGGGSKLGKLKAGLGFGKMHPGATAQPFFYPAYRMSKRGIKSRISRSASKAIKESL